jgi:hypothetical protein
MKQNKQPLTQKEIQQKLKEAKKAISKSFIKKYVTIYDNNTISFPGGMLMLLDDSNIWLLSVDYGYLENENDDAHGIFGMMSLFFTIKELTKVLPDLVFDSGYYCVFGNDGQYVDSLYNDEILIEMNKSGLFYSAAKAVLERQIIEKNEEKIQ